MRELAEAMKANTEAVRLRAADRLLVPMVTPGHIVDSPIVIKQTDTDRARAMLESNPALRGVSLRKLEETTGIQKTIWGRVKNETGNTQ